MHRQIIVAVSLAVLALLVACGKRTIEGHFICEGMPQSAMELRANGTWEDNAGARGIYTLEDGVLDLRITNRAGVSGRKEHYMTFRTHGNVLTEIRPPSSLYASRAPRWLRKGTREQ